MNLEMYHIGKFVVPHFKGAVRVFVVTFNSAVGSVEIFSTLLNFGRILGLDWVFKLENI